MEDLKSLSPEAVLENIPPQHEKLREIVASRLQNFVGLYIARSKLYAALNQILKEMAVLYRRDIKPQVLGGGKTYDTHAISEMTDVKELGAVLESAEKAMAGVSMSFDD
jgi:hypothetical protein